MRIRTGSYRNSGSRNLKKPRKRSLVKRIHMYFEGRSIWKAKMNMPLTIRIVDSKDKKMEGEVKRMKKMTSAYANKLLKSLEEDKQFWETKEANSSTYLVSNNEEAVIPEYDYRQVSDQISEIDNKIALLKHAINVNNAMARITVGDEEISVDTILIRMAQLNKRKKILDEMRKRNPKAREMPDRLFSRTNTVPEYRCINYDLAVVKADYETVSDMIMKLQMALDKHNQTVEFEVEL